jgi:hypothetical protein
LNPVIGGLQEYAIEDLISVSYSSRILTISPPPAVAPPPLTPQKYEQNVKLVRKLMREKAAAEKSAGQYKRALDSRSSDGGGNGGKRLVY